MSSGTITFHLIRVAFTFLVMKNVLDAKPRIEGPPEMKADVGENITIKCFADKYINWFKLINDSRNSELFDQESHTEHIDLHFHEYTEWYDETENGSETNIAALKFPSAKETDSGIYVCIYESPNFEQMVNKIKKKKSRFYSSFVLTVESKKPEIDVGSSVVVESGKGVNLTCSGNKPVTWVLMNNHTWGVQHTELGTGNKTEIYQSILQIEKVNYTDIGYLICKYSDESSYIYDDDVYKMDLNIALTYLFVKDLNHLLFVQSTNEMSAQLSSKIVVPCKPTFPEVDVTLTALDNSEISHDSYDPRRGFIINKSSKKEHEGFWQCNGEFGRIYQSSLMYINVHYNPILSGVNLTLGGAWQINALDRTVHTYDVIEKDVLMINCSSHYSTKFANIMWKTPPKSQQAKRHSLRVFESEGRTTERRLIPKVSVSKDSGLYSCYVTNGHVNSSAFNFILNVFPYDSWHLELRAQNENVTLRRFSTFPETLKWIVFFRAYPSLYLTWIVNGEKKIKFEIGKEKVQHNKPIFKRKEQYEIKVDWSEGEIILKIHSPTVRDTGSYLLSAEVPGKESVQENITLHFFKEGPPEEVRTTVGDSKELTKSVGSPISGECSTYGFPLPKVEVFFKQCNMIKECQIQKFLDIKNVRWNEERIVTNDATGLMAGKMSLKWEGVANFQGYYYCIANNTFGAMNSTATPLIISDSSIKNSKYLQIEVVRETEPFMGTAETEFIEGDLVTLTCRGNTLMTSSPLFWTVKRGVNSSFLLGNASFYFHEKNVTHYERKTKFSFLSLIRTKITRQMDGITLTCSDSSPSPFQHSINLTVIDSLSPYWTSKPLGQAHYEMSENEKLSLQCAGEGIPEPSVTWFKNDDHVIETNDADRRISVVDGNLTFQFLFPEDSGKYTCLVRNRVGSLEDFVTLEVRDPDAAPQRILIIVIGVVSALFVVLLIGLAVKLYRDRKADRMFIQEMQKRFNEGNPECLNPDLDLGEQADLLPYDSKFEFPRDRVTMENLLGSGAFGNVFKATARDLISGASKTTVAVKMMKSPANAAQMKTLISELKIMIHIGRHINIVNLLGACSKHMAAKGELLLIVEYCRHGNILEYMRRHKSEFVNQINEFDKIDPSLMYMRKRTYSNSRCSQRTAYAQLDLHRNSNYFPTNTDASQNIGINNNCNNSINNRGSLMENTFFPEKGGRRRIKSDSAANEPIVYTDMTVASIGHNYISDTTLEERGPLCSKDLLHWSYQIANGMFYLSEKKVIHGDLAARNILLADKNVVKISDFGLSKNIYKQENYKKKSECPLPVKWLALEALKDSIFSTHSDVWSYGVVLWEVFSLGANPYAGVEVDTEFVTKLEQGLRLSRPPFATSHLYELMMNCWQKNPNHRPSFRELERILGDMLGETEKQMYMSLNARYEEDNYVSEHLQYLNTPTYDSRVKGFFTEKDDYGYEKALLSPHPGVVMEMETSFPEPRLPEFGLHPVPKKRKPELRESSPTTLRERESLLGEETEESNYLIMKSPAYNENRNSNDETENNEVTYVNLGHLNKHNIATARRNSSQIPEALKEVSEDSQSGRIFVFGEMNQAETDSVFDGDYFVDKTTEKDSSFLRSNDAKDSSERSRYLSYHSKRDSGLYSPNMLQVNPLYVQTSSIDKTKKGNVETNPDSNKAGENNRGVRISKGTGEKKQRNQSDSSSGFGSLDDRYNSLENYKDEKLKESNDSVLKDSFTFTEKL